MELYAELDPVVASQFKIFEGELENLKARILKLTEWNIQLEKRLTGYDLREELDGKSL